MIKIKPSNRNTNKHTDDGMALLESSIDKVGVIESISVAEDGTIISGNARKEIFDKKGMRAKEIELAPDEFAVLRTNIKSESKEYYEAQILANTTAHKNYNLDIEEIDFLASEYDIDIEEIGVDIENYEDNKKDDVDASDLFNIKIPFYNPSKNKPSENELAYLEKYKNLIEKIDALDAKKELKELLKIRASFFVDFNFDKMADYFHHENENVKQTFKELGLVIVAPRESVNLGFVEIKEDLERI